MTDEVSSSSCMYIEGQCLLLGSTQFQTNEHSTTTTTTIILTPENVKDKSVLSEDLFDPLQGFTNRGSNVDGEHCFRECQGGLNVLTVDSTTEHFGFDSFYCAVNDNDSFSTDEEDGTEHVRDGIRKYRTNYRHIPHNEKPPHLVAKRNARERKRVQAVNAAFSRLRRVLPFAQGRSKRISKVRTLQEAINYIDQLQHLVTEHDRSVRVRNPKKQSPKRLDDNFDPAETQKELANIKHDTAKDKKFCNNLKYAKERRNAFTEEDSESYSDVKEFREGRNSLNDNMKEVPDTARREKETRLSVYESQNQSIQPVSMEFAESFKKSNQGPYEAGNESVYDMNQRNRESNHNPDVNDLNQVIVSSITNFI